MTTTSLRLLPALRGRPGMLRRALLAGSAWGLIMGFGMTAWSAMQCGVICLDAALMDTLGAVTVGIFIIGPLAACGRGT